MCLAIVLTRQLYIHSICTFGSHFHFKTHFASFLYLFIAAIDMHKNALLSFIVFYESIALGFVEKSDGAATDKVSGVNRFLFGNADLNVFKIELFSLSWIGRSGGNIPVLIDIS